MLTQLEVYKELKETMPSIGFLSRSKRINACFVVLYNAQQMIDNERATEDAVTNAVIDLWNNYKPFYKASSMTALMAPRFSAGEIPTGLCEPFIQHICSISGLPGFRWR